MTTTEVPLGIDEGKPSSRVLRPPGGGSSFSLGDSEARPQQPRQSSSDAGTTRNTPTSQPTATPDNPQSEGQSPSSKPNTSSHSRIFGDPDPSSPVPGRDITKGASAYNPITGEIYPGFEQYVTDLETVRYARTPSQEPKNNGNPITWKGQQKAQTEQATAAKVRQPPGGFSHGIF